MGHDMVFISFHKFIRNSLCLQAVCEHKKVKQFRRPIISFVANIIWYAHFKNLKFVWKLFPL